PPPALSNSGGSAEYNGETGWDGSWSFAGIPVTFSTGDSGYAGGTTYPASAPGVTAVGGTTLATDGSPRGWSEAAWSGANSGCSIYELKKSWQTDACANRTTADVSALAGYPGLA